MARLLALFALLATPAFAASPVGLWKTIDDKDGEPASYVEVKEEGGTLRGTITKLFVEPGEDPDPSCGECTGAEKDKPIVGMTIFSGLKDDGSWYSGASILDPENGKWYRCKVRLEGDDKLQVRGFLGPFYRTQTWHRVK